MILKPHPENYFNKAIDIRKELISTAKKLNDEFIDSITKTENCFQPTQPHPQEIHPYLKYRNKMLKKPKGYIIGTFPPSSYLRNKPLKDGAINDQCLKVKGISVQKKPQLDFYHGNKASFWELLGIEKIEVKEILNFLESKKWVYSDIIYSCSRKNIKSSNDSDLLNIVPNFDLIDEILKREDSPKLWFNTSGTFNQGGINVYKTGENKGYVNIKPARSYELFLRSLQNLGHKLKVRLNENDKWIDVNDTNSDQLKTNFRYIISHQLMVSDNKTYNIITGPSPSGQARITIRSNVNFQNWTKNQPHENQKPDTFIKETYLSIINGTIT